MPCGHLLCDIIGGSCSLAAHRSRGCRPNLTSNELAREAIDEVRQLVATIDGGSADAREAAVRLAAIIRREALEERNVIALVSSDEPELARDLARLCRRR
jgi:hypothetical protein